MSTNDPFTASRMSAEIGGAGRRLGELRALDPARRAHRSILAEWLQFLRVVRDVFGEQTLARLPLDRVVADQRRSRRTH